MTDAALLGNIAAYSLQIACLVALGGVLGRIIAIDVAAVRYHFWRALLVVCLALPWLQGRHAPGASPEEDAVGAIVSVTAFATTAATERSAGLPWPAMVLAVIAAGAMLRLAWVAGSLRALSRLRRAGTVAPEEAEAAELRDVIGARAEIRYVAELAHPVTFGARRPVVLLPEALRTQDAGIRRAVLCHELLHVRRRDWVWLLVEEVVRAALWFHPAVWWLVSRVQLAREEAVDEQAVLITGGRQTYMRALLAFADEPPLAPAAAFGRRHHLFSRIVLISKEAAMSSRRIVLSCAVMVMAVGAGGWLAVHAFPLVAGQGERSGPGALEQRAKPITPENPVPRRIHSAPIPYPVEVVDRGVRAVVTLRVTLDGSGRVAEARKIDGYLAAASVDSAARQKYVDVFARSAIAAVRQWQYDPPADAPISFSLTVAFQPDKDATLVGQNTAPLRAGAPPPPPPPPPPPAPWHEGALRVGGTIGPPTKIKNVNPVYPPEAKAAGVEGVVVIEARIEGDGRVSHTRVLQSVPGLDEAAVDAVRQWEFTPTLLNGKPTPVIMTVTIAFRLD